MFTLKEDKWYCDQDLQWYVNPSQILDNTMNELVVFGFGRVESGGKVLTYNHGAVITTMPSSIEIVDSNYTKLIYKKGDVFCKGTKTVKDSTYVEIYFSLCMNGKLVTNIPYEQHRVIRDNVLSKNKDLAVPLLFLDIHHAYIMKDKTNPLKEHRLNLDGEYVVMNPRESVVTTAGTFGASTFEDPIAMTMVNVTRKEKEEAVSVLEKYMLL